MVNKNACQIQTVNLCTTCDKRGLIHQFQDTVCSTLWDTHWLGGFWRERGIRQGSQTWEGEEGTWLGFLWFSLNFFCLQFCPSCCFFFNFLSSTLSNFIPTGMTQGSRAAGEGEESTWLDFHSWITENNGRLSAWRILYTHCKNWLLCHVSDF